MFPLATLAIASSLLFLRSLGLGFGFAVFPIMTVIGTLYFFQIHDVVRAKWLLNPSFNNRMIISSRPWPTVLMATLAHFT